MQRVIIINLNGNAYQVDEPGYNALVAYLDRAVAALKSNPDQAEIIADLEQAIAEKCQRSLGPNKTVVTETEIRQILQEMGPVDGDAGERAAEPAAAGTKAPDDKKQSTTGGPKRLYQIREGAKISGVCMGLAVYFNIDVTVVRLIFVVLGFLSGLGVLAYIILMSVIPYADTSEERAAAHGEKFSAQEIIDQATKNFADFRANKTWRRQWRQQRRQWRQGWRRTYWNAMGAPAVASAGVGTRVAAGVLLPVFSIVTVVAGLLLVVALISLFTTGDIFGWTIPPHIPRWAAALVLMMIYQAIAAPSAYMRHVVRGPYGRPAIHFGFAPGGVLWIGMVVFCAWWGYHHVPEVHDFIQRLAHAWHHLVHDV